MLKKNWEVKAGFLTKARNLYKKGGFNPAFYVYRYRFNNYPKKFKVGAYPLDIIAELSNICNLRCTMCFQGDEALQITKTTKVPLMSMDTFKIIVDQCADLGVPALKLNWRGESLLNEHFTEMVRYAKGKEILEVTSLTNGTRMDESMCRELVNAKMDQIVVSIDGLTKETYERIRVGANYEEVIGNVETLLRVRGNKRKPFIRVQYTQSDVNSHETEAFYEHWKQRVDEVAISYAKDFGSPNNENPEDCPVYEYCCQQPFQRLIIMADGTVTVCATDVTGSIVIGNVHDTSLVDLWNCQKLNELRQQHISGQYHLNPMCRICVHHLYKSNEKSGRLDA
ncbi:radical SAM/SPASM domain-containing protein [Thermodesulfobacteriota bacterium]